MSDIDGKPSTAWEDVGAPLPCRLAPGSMSEGDTATRYDAECYFDAGTEISPGMFVRIDATVWNVGACWPGPAVVRAELRRVQRS